MIEPMNPESPSAIVLVIDDDALIRESIATYLADSGFNVLQADDGPSGLACLQERQPDAVLLDLRMPEMDGLDVLARITGQYEGLPVIVVTGAGVLKDAIEALRMGAFDFISKPIIDMAILEHSLRRAIEGARLRAENRRYREHLEAEIQKRTWDLKARTIELEQTNSRLEAEMAERRRTKTALEHSQSRLADILAVFEGYIYTVSGDYRIQFINSKLESLLGQPAIGKICHRTLYDRETACPWCPLDQVMSGRTVRTELESPRDGRWYYGIYSPQPDAHNHLEGCQAVVIDIHERKMAEEALRRREAQLREQNLRLRSSMRGTVRFGEIIGKSDAMRAIYRTILKAAESSASVMIYGESGTGKELVAKTIHELSDRGGRPFVTVNCGAIPDTLIESEFFGYKKGAFTGADRDKTGFLSAADGGTLFLDEVGEINPNMQIKLLRAVEGGGFSPLGSSRVIRPDIRIVAATNRNLQERIASGQFRKDFFYRLHIIPIHLPPLRERRADIPLLIHHFLQLFGDDNKLQSIPEAIMQAMQRYDWPGNVRELQNAVRQYIALQEMDVIGSPGSDPVATADQQADNRPLIEKIVPHQPLHKAVQQFERQYIEHLLNKYQWHRIKVADILGIDRRTLFRKIKSYGIE